jgi:hypothetical protein
MKFGKALAVSAAILLTAAPIAAQAASGVENARSGTEVEGEEIGGSLLLPLLALAALVVVVVVATGDDDESPASP